MAKKDGDEYEANLNRLKTELKTDRFGRLYLFHGEEVFLRNNYLNMLKSKLLEGPAKEFNFHRFTKENTDIKAIVQAAEAMPMMADRTMLQIDDLEFNRLSEDERSLLTEMLSDIPEYCSVVFVFDTVPYTVDNRHKKLIKVLEDGLNICFRHQNQRELTGWIRRHFRSDGKEIGDRQCELLVFLTGGDMTLLLGEIGKLSAYAVGDTITEQDIWTVVIPVLDAEIFDITDAIADGNYERALEKLRIVLQGQEEPILLLGAIGSAMRRLYYAKVIMGAGKGEGTLSELLRSINGRSPHTFVLRKTMSTARRLSDSFCQKAVALCLQTDRTLKSRTTDAQQVLEFLILELAQEALR